MDPGEFNAAMKQLGLQLREDEVKVIFMHLDRDGDGEMGLDEFLRKTKEVRRGMRTSLRTSLRTSCAPPWSCAGAARHARAQGSEEEGPSDTPPPRPLVCRIDSSPVSS